MDWVISHIKQIFGVASFILLLVAIPATMYLVRQQQVVRSRAAEEDLTLNLYKQSGAQSLDLINGNLTTSDRSIKVQVVYNPATTSSPTPAPPCIPSGGSCNVDSQPCCQGYCDAEGFVDGTCRRN